MTTWKNLISKGRPLCCFGEQTWENDNRSKQYHLPTIRISRIKRVGGTDACLYIAKKRTHLKNFENLCFRRLPIFGPKLKLFRHDYFLVFGPECFHA